MSGKKWFVHTDVLDRKNALPRLAFQDAIEQQYRIAMWQILQNFVDIQTSDSPERPILPKEVLRALPPCISPISEETGLTVSIERIPVQGFPKYFSIAFPRIRRTTM